MQLSELQAQRANLADQVEVLGGAGATAGAAGASSGATTAAASAAAAAAITASLGSLKLEGDDLAKVKALEQRCGLTMHCLAVNVAHSAREHFLVLRTCLRLCWPCRAPNASK
jgi:hypothetical protein